MANRWILIAGLSISLTITAAWGEHNPGHDSVARDGVTNLRNDVDAGNQSRIAADQALQEAIDAESAARIAADDALQQSIDQEAAARIAADQVLHEAIDQEAAARIVADETLHGAVDQLDSETTLSDMEDSCSSGEVVKRNGAGGWFCAADDVGDGVIADTLSGLDCAQGDVTVFFEGQWRCASDLSPPGRFVDNGDGTVTDNETGLMWEKKLSDMDAACSDLEQALRDVRCMQNDYSWTADGMDGTAPNGTLYTEFLARLNLEVALSRDDTCFANHCDWRIPNIWELKTILLEDFQCSSSPCIDPIFGPTKAQSYWSSTSRIADPGSAWIISFNSGLIFTDSKWDEDPMNPGINFARAVRRDR